MNTACWAPMSGGRDVISSDAVYALLPCAAGIPVFASKGESLEILVVPRAGAHVPRQGTELIVDDGGDALAVHMGYRLRRIIPCLRQTASREEASPEPRRRYWRKTRELERRS